MNMQKYIIVLVFFLLIPFINALDVEFNILYNYPTSISVGSLTINTYFTTNGTYTKGCTATDGVYTFSYREPFLDNSHVCEFDIENMSTAGNTIDFTLESCTSGYTDCDNTTFTIGVSRPVSFDYMFRDIYASGSNLSIRDNNSLTDTGSYYKGTTEYADEIVSYSIDWDSTECDPVSYVFSENPDPLYGSYDWVLETGCRIELEGNYSVEICLDTLNKSEVCQTENIEIKGSFYSESPLGYDEFLYEDSSGLCEFQIDYNRDRLSDCVKGIFTHYWYDLDSDGYVDSSGTYPPLVYTGTDCIDENCSIELDRSTYHLLSYCDANKTLQFDNTSVSDSFDVYSCYDTNAWNYCSNCYDSTMIGYDFSKFVDMFGFDDNECSGGVHFIDDPDVVGYSDVSCNSVYNGSIDSVFYDGCDAGDLDDTEGTICIPIKTITIDCLYDCSDFDYDGDGVNDCDDVCCGFDDLNDTDSDGIPYDCDICPTSSDHTDYDGDGFPDCVGTCNDGLLTDYLNEVYIDYGGVCGTCEDGVLSPLIGETEIDYNGKCGFCEVNVSKSDDWMWLGIDKYYYPFDQEAKCEEGKVIISFVGLFVVFVVLLMAIVLFGILGFLLLPYFFGFVGIIRFFVGKKKKNKKFK